MAVAVTAGNVLSKRAGNAISGQTSPSANAQTAAWVAASSEMVMLCTCVDVAQDAADGGAQVVLGTGLHGCLEARLADHLLPRQALLALVLAVRRAAFIAAAVLLTHHKRAQNVLTYLPADGHLHEFTAY